ncbi:glycosyltransferase [Methylobacterium pseudosasicola]|uniref:Glycosyltransferase involved in cell wall bisynthesis n=1 Tax=Methylobacterium pseudosasicola TaxID=582667 RepID=A0A1I4TS08_9HYPH|nr:glycosyltransferase [Methylobacterium pseudosasicola]SFM79534.1 Glycosyltransferase involved in cell wall bisynthesis [Methylobacterium pseudosasicola]
MDLLKAMIQQSPDIEYNVILNNNITGLIEEIKSELLPHLPVDKIYQFGTFDNSSYNDNNHNRTVSAELLREKFICDLNPDVLHITSLIEGLSDNVVTSVGRLEAGYPTAVTLYDLIPAKFPQSYLQNNTARQHYIEKVNYLRKAELLLAISEYSKTEFYEFFPDYRGSIVNVRGGVDSKFRHIESETVEYRFFATKYGLHKFILYTASYDERKNQRKLIEAYSLLSSKIREEYKLVFIGNGWPEIYKNLRLYATELGLKSDQIVFTGHISEHLLIELYSRCSLFAFVSLAEGLGLPILEAMACHAPVIASNTTCLPEVVDNPNALFDPRCARDIADTITRVLGSELEAEKLIAHGSAQVAKFTWDQSASVALRAIHSIVNGSRPYQVRTLDARRSLFEKVPAKLSREEKGILSRIVTKNEIETDTNWATEADFKLGWVSTWNSKCGIATYSEHITTHCDRHVVPIAPFNQPRELSELTRTLNRGWNIDDNADLSGILRIIKQKKLDALMIQVNYGLFKFPSLASLIHALFAEQIPTFVTFHSTVDPKASGNTNRLGALSKALVLADKIFVHSKNDIDRLKRIGVSKNVSLLPHGMNSFELLDRLPPAHSRSVAAYGFFLPNKGFRELIEAAAIAEAANQPFNLILVCSNYGDDAGISTSEIQAARNLAKDLGISGKVDFVTEFLSDERSVELLSFANLIVYPYQQSGESASGAVRFGIAAGRPVAVTPLSIFDDVSSLTHTLPGTDPHSLQSGINDLLQQIETNAEPVRSTTRRAEQWRKNSDYRHISHYIMRQVRLSLARNWIEFAKPPIATLPTQAGTKLGDRIRSTGSEGVVVYGPYIEIPSGMYKLELYLEKLHLQDENCSIKITSDFGTNSILNFSITSETTPVVSEMFFTETPLSNVEVVVHCSDGSIIDVFGYCLYRRL